MQWFRFYSEVLNDPKVQSLDGETFKAWINLLCVTSQCDGVIRFDDVSFHLRMPDQQAWDLCRELCDKGLLDTHDDGYVPHGWEKRQYKSDTSAERTKRYRDRKKEESRDVTVTPPDTEQKQIQNRAEKKVSTPLAPKGESYQFSLPAWMPEKSWGDFCEHRKKLRKPMSPKAMELTVTELDRLRMAGNDPESVLNQSIQRGWQGIFEIHKGDKNANNDRQFATKLSKSDRARAAVFADFEQESASPLTTS